MEQMWHISNHTGKMCHILLNKSVVYLMRVYFNSNFAGYWVLLGP